MRPQRKTTPMPDRLALIGPTHPYKGGIAAHTTALAHRLAATGLALDLVSWSAQYPAFLYPGALRLPDDRPELPIYPRTTYPLSWYRPDTWVRTASQLRAHHAIVPVLAAPVQVPIYRTMLAAAPQVRAVAVAHNLLPHERRLGDRVLMSWMLRRLNGVLVHSPRQHELARELGATHVEVAQLPLHFAQDVVTLSGTVASGRVRLLFFGVIRPYKGLDVLLRSLPEAPAAELVIAGEFWSGAEETRELIAALDVGDRVRIIPSYVPAADLPALFADADALVLPYRSATATQNIQLAAAHGKPVVATRIEGLAEQVRDGVDGLLVPPEDPAALAVALRRLSEPGTLARLRAGVVRPDAEGAWDAYIAAFRRLLESS
jgi:glycosyltransferase involved in cell wall biosynthesis